MDRLRKSLAKNNINVSRNEIIEKINECEKIVQNEMIEEQN